MKSWGHIAYDAYHRSLTQQAVVSHGELPSWEQLPDSIRKAWAAAGTEVVVAGADAPAIEVAP